MSAATASAFSAVSANKKMNTVATPYTDLDARTQFVLNRVEFLQNVWETLQNENRPEMAAKIALWRDNNYIPLIARCVMDPSVDTYDQALWAIANLLGSDDPRVAEITIKSLNHEILMHIASLAIYGENPSVVHGAEFVIFNLVNHVENMESVPAQFTRLICSDILKQTVNKSDFAEKHRVGRDILEAMLVLAEKFPESLDATVVFNDILPQTYESLGTNVRILYRKAVAVVGALAEKTDYVFQKSFIAHFIKACVSQFRKFPVRLQRDVLWTLSNMMTEVDTAIAFFENTEVRSMVTNLVWENLCSKFKDVDNIIGREALYVLANYVNTAGKSDNAELKQGIADDFAMQAVFVKLQTNSNETFQQLATESMAQVNSFKPEIPAAEEIESSDSEESFEAFESGPPLHHEFSVPLFQRDEYPEFTGSVPSASDLVLGDSRGFESSAVRRIVGLLTEMPLGEWVFVPTDWTLTVGDLTTIQNLGYVIKDGYIGINPEIFTSYE